MTAVLEQNRAFRGRPWEGKKADAWALVSFERREWYFDVSAGVFREAQVKWEMQPTKTPGAAPTMLKNGYHQPPRFNSPLETSKTVEIVYDYAETNDKCLLDAYLELRGTKQFSPAWIEAAKEGRRTWVKSKKKTGRIEVATTGVSEPLADVTVPSAPAPSLKAPTQKRAAAQSPFQAITQPTVQSTEETI